MRCYCCNKLLNDYESTNKDLKGNYLDTCNKCLKGLQIGQLGRPDLDPNEEVPDDEEMYEYVEELYEDDEEWVERND